jgi:hypothetical protein
MDEKKSTEAVYSAEPTRTTGPDSLRSTPETPESSGAQKTASASRPTQAGPTQAAPAMDAQETPRTGGYFQEINRIGAGGPTGDFLEFLKSTKRVWLSAAAAIIGLLLVVTLAKSLFKSASASREARQQREVGMLTAEGLLRRCGQPTEDVTKEMYPIVMRTISYQRGEKEKYVFEFSRTAEEKSDWVFLSMKDPSGAKKFDTPEEKIAAMSCLDSSK